MVAPRFSSVTVVMSGDVVKNKFFIALMIFGKVLPMDLCDGLEFITTGLNGIELPWW